MAYVFRHIRQKALLSILWASLALSSHVLAQGSVRPEVHKPLTAAQEALKRLAERSHLSNDGREIVTKALEVQ